MLSFLHAVQIIDLVAAVQFKWARKGGPRGDADSAMFAIFKDMHASDEMFFPSILSVLGYIPSVTVANAMAVGSAIDCSVVQGRVTYCDWSCSPKNPRTFASWRECCAVGAAKPNGSSGGALSNPSLSSSSSSSPSSSSSHFESARREGCLFIRKWKWSPPAPLITFSPTSPTKGAAVENIKATEEQDELLQWVASVYPDRSTDRSLNECRFDIRTLSATELRSIAYRRTTTDPEKNRAAAAEDECRENDAKRRKTDG